MSIARRMTFGLAGCAVLLAAQSPVRAAEFAASPSPDRWLDVEWTNFTRAEGLPAEDVRCVLVAGGAVWVGTSEGLACRTGNGWQTWTKAAGLADDFVSSLAWDEQTGALWIGTLHGMSRLAAGKLTSFDQLNSGLADNAVYGLSVAHGDVWCATASGVSRYRIATDRWTLYDGANTPANDLWCAGITAGDGGVFVALSGAGVIGFESQRKRWQHLVDPDGDGSVDQSAHDGLLHDVTTAVAVDARGRLWIGTPVGLSLREGDSWRSFRTADSPLPHDTVRCLRAEGEFVWVGTDDGLARTDGRSWWVYRQNRGLDRVEESANPSLGLACWHGPNGAASHSATAAALPARGVRDMAVSDDGVWVATSAGLAHGRFGRNEPPCRAFTVCPTREWPSPARPGRPTPHDVLPERAFFAFDTRFHELPAPVRAPAVLTSAASPLSAAPRIGLLVPLDNARDADLGRMMLDAATLAVEQHNRSLPNGAPPAELVVRKDQGVWSSPAEIVLDLVRRERVIAVLAPIDGGTSNILLRAADRLGLPVIATACTDPALAEAGCADLLRTMPDERMQAYTLAREIYGRLGLVNVVLIGGNDRAGRCGLEEFRAASERFGRPIWMEFRHQPGDYDFRQIVERISGFDVGGVVLWTSAPDAAEFLRQLRASGSKLPVFGGARLVCDNFLKRAGSAAEGLVAVATCDLRADSPAFDAFRRNYLERFRRAPDAWAAYAYDGTMLVLDAARRAVTHRTSLADELRATTRYDGITGRQTFDTTGNNVRPLLIAKVESGLFHLREPPAALDAPALATELVRAHMKRNARWKPHVPDGPHSVRGDLNIGCFLPLDARGLAALRGLRAALEEDRAAHPRGPHVCLRVLDARGDHGMRAQGLADLAVGDEISVLVGPFEREGLHWAALLAEAANIPCIPLGPCEESGDWIMAPGVTLPPATRGASPDALSDFENAARALGRALVAELRRSGGARDRLRDALRSADWPRKLHDAMAAPATALSSALQFAERPNTAFLSPPEMMAPASTAEVWRFVGGMTAIKFNDAVNPAVGITVPMVISTARPAPLELAHMEPPFTAFAIHPASTLEFQVAGVETVLNTMLGGSVLHEGGFELRIRCPDGKSHSISLLNFVIERADRPNEPSRHDEAPDVLFLRENRADAPLLFRLSFAQAAFIDGRPVSPYGSPRSDPAIYTLTPFGPTTSIVWVGSMDIIMMKDFAERLGRPDLAGHALGMLELHAVVEMVGGEPAEIQTPTLRSASRQ